MKAIYGTVRSVKPYASSGNCVVEIEIPVEHFIGAAPFYGGSVLVTLASLGNRPYGIVDSEVPGDSPIAVPEDLATPATQVLRQSDPAPVKARFPGGLCGLAVRWCGDAHFQDWLDVEFSYEMAAVRWCDILAKTPEDQAKAVVLAVCGVTSRKELDKSTTAGDAFRRKFLEPYGEAREKDGIDE